MQPIKIYTCFVSKINLKRQNDFAINKIRKVAKALTCAIKFNWTMMEQIVPHIKISYEFYHNSKYIE
jgi:hypothetical protein